MRLLTTLFTFGALGLGACATDDKPIDPGPTPRATWFQDVAPIVSQHCMSCHQAGGIAPFALTDYESAKENGERMLVQTDKGVMPPFDAREESDCTPRFNWVDDPRLSVADKATLHAWVEDGMAMGTEAPIPAIPKTELQGVTKTLVPSVGFAASGDKDQFECFILDPKVAQLTFLTGVQLNPDVKEVVHHAVITEVAPGKALDDLKAAHPDFSQPFVCNTQPGDFVVNIWTPGNQPFQTSADIAVPVFAGAVFVMQIHYHPAGAAHNPDKTSVDLRFSSATPKAMYFVAALGNAFQAPNLLPDPDDVGGIPQFIVPPNKADHREHMRFTVANLNRTDLKIFSANPHMHLIGTHINGTIERPTARGNDPKTECLANGGWNFDWQRTYIYDSPLDKLPSVQDGDIVDIKCSWDNTISNPFVERMLKDSGLGTQPVEVKLGEQTTNEMCLEIFGLAVPVATQRMNQETMLRLMPHIDPNVMTVGD